MVALASLSDELADRLLRSRTIVIGGEINDPLAEIVISKLYLLERENDSADITMMINSPGGSVTSGLAIHDAMEFISCDVATVATGLAASMGQVLLCSGQAGKRFALPTASIMMHQGSAGVGGAAADIAIQADNLIRMSRLMNEILATRTGRQIDVIEADSDRDQWYSPQEALDYGMIDHVVTTRVELEQQLHIAKGAQ